MTKQAGAFKSCGATRVQALANMRVTVTLCEFERAELDAQVTARVPTRTNTDDRYFTDTYQAMPLHGYTRMFERML